MTLHESQPIVVVEDSEDDFEATERALKRDGPLMNPIVHFDNGTDALNYLLRKPPYADETGPRPGLVLLDLNLPGIGGREILVTLKNDEATRSIPVIVLTTSDDDWDISHCYEAGANTYIKKPVELDGFFAAIQSLRDYWLNFAILPRSG